MVVNGTDLLSQSPIVGMMTSKVKLHGVSYGLSEAGYDIRIKQKIEFKRHNSGFVIFLDDQPNRLEDGSLDIGRFTIASAMEEFSMPKNLVGIVHDKSTWARQGLSVFNTVVEPGWNGFLTLELVYHGNKDLLIPAGAGIAQVIFHEISCVADYGTGKYQNQEDMPVASRWVSDQPQDMIGQYGE